MLQLDARPNHEHLLTGEDAPKDEKVGYLAEIMAEVNMMEEAGVDNAEATSGEA